SFLFRGMAVVIIVGATLISLSCGNSPQLRTIAVLPQAVNVAGTPTIVYTAVGHYANSKTTTTKDLTGQVTWKSSIPDIVAFSDPAHPNWLIPTGQNCGANIGVTATMTPNSGKAIVGAATVNVQCDTAGVDFALSTDQNSVTASAGSTANFNISVVVKSGGSPTIDLTAGGLPNGATASFASPTLTGGGVSKLSIFTTAGLTPPGTYRLKVTGTDASGILNLTVTLVVI
ncbi:MAG: hypothetical protein J2P13_10910, partial [Acidobacteria bacterium]|nr:hypothetical protein [Acidobacteriota bacterium]